MSNEQIWIPGRGALSGTWVEARFGGVENGLALCFSPIPGEVTPVERPLDEIRFQDPGEERPRAGSVTVYGANGRVHLQQLSHTRVSVLRDCAAKYGFRYVDRLRPRIEKDPTRIRGRSLHVGLEAGYRAWRTLRLLEAPVEGAVIDIVAAAGRAAKGAHERTLEELEAARDAGAPVDTYDRVRGELEDAYDADAWALRHFFEVIVRRDYSRKIPILVEQGFDVPIVDARGRATHLRWIGFLDVVMYDEKMRILEVHESKTVANRAGGDEHRRRIEGDPQTTSYVYALRAMQAAGELDRAIFESLGVLCRPRDIPVGAVVVNVIRRKRAPSPKVLSDGTVSTDQRTDTLPEIYEEALEVQPTPGYLLDAGRAVRADWVARDEAAQDVSKNLNRLEKRVEKTEAAYEKKRAAWRATQAKQLALLDRLRERGDTFLSDVEQFVTEAEVERWRGEQWIEADRMRRIERRPAERTRNLAYCTSPGRGCGFRTLCYSGGDAQVRATEFTTPEERAAAKIEEVEKPDLEELETAPFEASSGWT